MKHKIISMVGAVALTFATFSAVATPTVVDKTVVPTVEQTLTFCAASYKAFQNGDEGAFLNEGLKRFDVDTRRGIALMCLAYGVGYEDGVAHGSTT